MVPPTGFEPVISTLKGWRPGPLDDGGIQDAAIIPACPEFAKLLGSVVGDGAKAAELALCVRSLP